MEKTCLCGLKFMARGNKTYCSIECKKKNAPKRIRDRHKEVDCPGCGVKTTTTRTEGYCSRVCCEIHKGRRIKLTCDCCTKTYSKKKSHVGVYVKNFCSNECHNEFNKCTITKECEACGELFTRVPSAAKRFCSISCSQINPDVNFSKELIEKLYVDDDLTTREIGFQLGTSKTQILRHIKKFNIEPKFSGFKNKKLILCKDGHEVKSHYERAFDNALTTFNLDHEYEPRLPWNKKYAADFKVNDVYVEIWGMVGWDKYEAIKERKEKIYKDNNAKVFSIYPDDFKDVYRIIHRLKELLA
ncbi:MAG: hypothetical protein R3328_00010 [Planococcaceae bacterium]|nr:hypothetical protein [Planococcaceae bacterium]